MLLLHLSVESVASLRGGAMTIGDRPKPCSTKHKSRHLPTIESDRAAAIRADTAKDRQNALGNAYGGFPSVVSTAGSHRVAVWHEPECSGE